MHRSGTSPLTRVLSLLGADLPSVLMPPAPGDNELGFWEPDEIVKIHDELLSDVRSSWDDVSPFPESWYGSEAAVRFRGEILRILGRDFSRSTLFVLKDPRICRFVPFWLTTLDQFVADARFVISVRHPLEVAASLKVRNEFSRAKSVLLWLWHLLEAERETRKQKRSFVFYEALLQDWGAVAARVSKDLGISWPRMSAESAAGIDQFLSSGHRHHSHGLEDLAGADIAGWAKQAYEIVLESWDSPGRLAKSLDGIRRELLTAHLAYGPVISEARLGLSAKSQVVERLTNELREREGELAEKDKEVDRLTGELAASARELSEKDDHVLRLSGELAARGRKLTESDKHLVGLSNELKKRDREIAEKENRIYALSGALRKRDRELSEKLEDMVSLAVSLSERNRELGEQKEEVFRLSSQLQVTAHQLRRMERVLQGVLSSKSWRATEPLRSWAAGLRSLRSKVAVLRSSEREAPAQQAGTGNDFFNGRRAEESSPVERVDTQGWDGVRRAMRTKIVFRGDRRRFALYVASRGNYFFGEIRDLLAAGLRDLDFEVTLRTELDGFVEDVDWHLVIAPHEFFYLGAGAALREGRTPANLILFNTEQPTTKWFTLASDCFHKAHCIWDIHQDSSLSIAEMGLPCHYVPLGYVDQSNPFPEVEALPENYHTCFLEPAVRQGAYLNTPLVDRPIDVLFLGTITPRREAFFAAAAPVLANHRCYLSLPDASRPKIVRAGVTMDTLTATGLAQRAKIVLNVHRDRDNYFEWHRIVMHGIWHKALVLSEECSSAPPLRAGIDFAQAPLSELPKRIAYYLSDPVGRKKAQVIASQGFQTLTTKCQLKEMLRPLILGLYSEAPAASWQTATPGSDMPSQWLGQPSSAPAFPE
jgi:hypothetical protein